MKSIDRLEPTTGHKTQLLRTLLLNEGTPETKRQELLHYFQQTYSLYEQLFELLKSDEAYYQVADPLRYPLIFYFAHTATFFINKLLITKLISTRVNPTFESMFAVGVDEMSWDDLNKNQHAWPAVQEVRDYRDEVCAVVTEVIMTLPLDIPVRFEDPAWIILMGIEHERIHLETSSVLIRQLPLELVRSDHPVWERCHEVGIAPRNQLLPVAGREVVLGKSLDANTYGWDNEYGSAVYTVNDFKVSQFLVSNQEFYAFILAGGYSHQAWWTDEGWRWSRYLQATMPRFWRQHNDEYYLRLLNDEIPMPWNWPVEVNYLEAKAFCNWKAAQENKKIRLPTEAEWRVLTAACEQTYPQWDVAPGNINLEHFASPCPVDYFQQGELFDVIGNVWQWTETPIQPYQGFKVHPAYDDFSIPTFDGKHNLMKGGSWISTGNEALLESRYAFRRHFYQHAGFRYVESEQACEVTNMGYESDKLLSEYLEFHFGKDYFGVANYPKAIADIALSACAELPKKSKALDLGCAVGRAAFELSKYFASVYGVDFSARFINSAVQLQVQGHLKYALTTEGDLADYREIALADLQLTAEQANRLQFLQGDACNLPKDLCDFDLIIASNLIDRLYDPALFLATIHEKLIVGGILVLSSPYTWLEEHTEKSKWLGGFKKDGETVTTLSSLQAILRKHFVMQVGPQNVPFVIRETQRKFQHSVAEVTVWRRIK
jgi:5-histidylcysteine sulfoxide synthase/putative 4-mercaptohistidine N1-methyltranferase